MKNNSLNPSAPLFDRRDRIAALIIFAIAVAARIYGFDSESWSVDEAITLRVINLPFLEIFGERLSRGHSPLYFIFLKFWSTAPLGRLWLLLPSIAAGAASAPLALLTVRKLSRESLSPAAFAGLLFALAPLQIMHSQQIRPYPFMVLFAALSLYYMVDADRPTANRRLAASLILLAATHLFTIFFIGAILVGALASKKITPKTAPRLFAIPLLISAAAAAASLYAGAGSQFIIHASSPFGAFFEILFLIGPGYPNPAPSSGGLFVAGLVPALALFINGLYRSMKGDRTKIIGASMLAYLVAIAALLAFFPKMNSSRYLLASQALFFPTIGLGITEAPKRLFRALALLTAILSLAVCIKRIEHIARPSWDKAAALVADNSNANEPVFYFSLSDDNPFLVYYQKKNLLSYRFSSQFFKAAGSDRPHEAYQMLDEKLEKAEGFWLVTDRLLFTLADSYRQNSELTLDPSVKSILNRVEEIDRRVRSIFCEHFPNATTSSFSGVDVTHYHRAKSLEK